MLSSVSFAVVVAFLAVGAVAQQEGPASAAASETARTSVRADVRGVWKVTELASRASGADWEVRTAPRLSQYIFTDKHYSYMYVPGADPRKVFTGDPNKPTAAEKAQAYNSLVAATGTYALSGRTLTLNAIVHKNPNEMVGKPLVYAVEFGGDTMRMVIADPPFLPGREWRIVLTRIE
jgi:hypothetical protein